MFFFQLDFSFYCKFLECCKNNQVIRFSILIRFFFKMKEGYSHKYMFLPQPESLPCSTITTIIANHSFESRWWRESMWIITHFMHFDTICKHFNAEISVCGHSTLFGLGLYWSFDFCNCWFFNFYFFPYYKCISNTQ